MAELPAITTAPAPNRDFIQIYTKLSTKAISLGFWEANLRSQRQHDIDSSTIDTLTATTSRSQITDIEFYGAPVVLGFMSQPNGKHAVAFLSPAFKTLLPLGNLKTTTANTFSLVPTHVGMHEPGLTDERPDVKGLGHGYDDLSK